MTISELKQLIEQRTGVPAALLNTETTEETISQAKALLAYRREHDINGQEPKRTDQAFAAWFDAMTGQSPHDEAINSLSEIEEFVRRESGGYPIVSDSGEADGILDGRSTVEQFSEWLGQRTAYNPFTASRPDFF